jgi:hypothetical protein
MKMTAKHFFVKAALTLGLVLPFAAQGQSDENIPTINFQTVPITTAIQNLAQMANLNYIINPKLFVAADGTMKPEPALTLHWQNCTAANALARVLKENHLVMVTNAFTTVACITGTNAVANPVDAKLLGDDTNGVIPIIRFGDAPIDIVLKDIIEHDHLKVVLDPEVSGEGPPQVVYPEGSGAPPPEPSDFKVTMRPTVSVNWHNLTARQVVVELCEVYGLVIVKDSSPDSVVIKYRK